jgi:hypothetical protein
MKPVLVTLAWCFCAVGCGGSTASASGAVADAAVDVVDVAESDAAGRGEAAVRGTALGHAFSPHDALAFVNHPQMNSSIPNIVTLLIPANFDETCAQAKQDTLQNAARPNTADLAIYVSAGQDPLVVGTYVAASGTPNDAGAMTVSGNYVLTDSNCSRASEETLSGGSVTVTAVNATAISGIFDLTFPSGDRLSGEFAAPLCYVYVPQTGLGPPPVKCLH